MKMNKEKFLKTEFGAELETTIKALDFYIEEQSKISMWKQGEEYIKLQNDINNLFSQWNVYKLAVKQFFEIEYNFTRTDEYFGLVTEDETDWLFKILR